MPAADRWHGSIHSIGAARHEGLALIGATRRSMYTVYGIDQRDSHICGKGFTCWYDKERGMTTTLVTRLLDDVRQQCANDSLLREITLTLGRGMDVCDCKSNIEILVEGRDGYSVWIMVLSSKWLRHLLGEIDAAKSLHDRIIYPGCVMIIVDVIDADSICQALRSLRSAPEPTPDRELSL